jgi:hypothetical protein
LLRFWWWFRPIFGCRNGLIMVIGSGFGFHSETKRRQIWRVKFIWTPAEGVRAAFSRSFLIERMRNAATLAADATKAIVRFGVCL